MDSIEKCIQRIEDLEWRLEWYHGALEECIEHDRRFQMDATWGLVRSNLATFPLIGALIAAHLWGLQAWYWYLAIAMLVPIAAAYFAVKKSDEGKAADLAKLSRLPKWDD